jgi:hypothetical protein
LRFIIPLGKRKLRQHGRNPNPRAQSATVNAGTLAASLPEDVALDDLGDLFAVTSSNSTIRSIVETVLSSYCENRDNLPIVVRPVRATIKKNLK